MQRRAGTSGILACILAAAPAFFSGVANGQEADEPAPQWLWSSINASPAQVAFLRHTFEAPAKPAIARMLGAADRRMTVYVNGHEAVRVEGRAEPTVAELARYMQKGRNVIAIRAENDDDRTAAIAMNIEIVMGGFRRQWVISGEGEWRTSTQEVEGWSTPEFDDAQWAAAFSHGRVDQSTHPFGDGGMAVAATDVSHIETITGFRVELVRSARKNEGSWISLAFDPQGRITLGVENGGALRLTLDERGEVADIEPLNRFPGESRAFLYAYDSLYANVTAPDGKSHGVYRLRDTDGDDQFDDVRLIGRIEGSPGHGRNGLALGPDGMIYVICGDAVTLAEEPSADSPHRHRGAGVLLERSWDPRPGRRQPERSGSNGFVARTDPDGKSWQLFAAGLRNPYDLAFNEDGELFTFDADMEPDAGTPWYRPCRVSHMVKSGEYGWRVGSATWPDYYDDSLPPVVDIGLASPTGVCFGSRARFPTKHRQALYICDWSYGRIIAVHMQPNGASYSATFEDFISGRPFNVTDAVIGPDGAMYITTGGRGTQSGLYRVRYAGELDDAAEPRVDPAVITARAIRHQLERFHGRTDPAAVDTAWPHLSHPDRFVRFAARLALEHQPPSAWHERALAESNPEAAATALLAYVRTADAPRMMPLLDRLHEFAPRDLNERQTLSLLRTYSLSLIELAWQLDQKLRRRLIDRFEAMYPSSDDAINRELSRLLVYLNSPTVVSKTLALLADSDSAAQQMHYAWVLRNVEDGWTPELRRRYFSWFNHAQQFIGGAALHGHINQIRDQALAHLSEREIASIKDVLEAGEQAATFGPPAADRPFVRDWQVGDIEPLFNRSVTRRSFDNGRATFIAAGCAACHRVRNLGTAVGPDLTAAGARFAPRDILEAIIDPSKVMDEKFQAQLFTLIDGSTVAGMVAREDAQAVYVIVNLYQPAETIELPRDRIRAQIPSPVSLMPAGLLNTFNQQQIVDLIAFIESGGDPNSLVYKR